MGANQGRLSRGAVGRIGNPSYLSLLHASANCFSRHGSENKVGSGSATLHGRGPSAAVTNGRLKLELGQEKARITPMHRLALVSYLKRRLEWQVYQS